MGFLFRIETDKHEGPYTGPVCGWIDWEHNDHNDNQHPARFDSYPDISKVWTKRHIFGFATIEQCVQWFTLKEIQTLSEKGLRFVVYWVKDLTVTTYQAIAIPTKYSRVIHWSELIMYYKLG